jgi:hypothetical protein
LKKSWKNKKEAEELALKAEQERIEYQNNIQYTSIFMGLVIFIAFLLVVSRFPIPPKLIEGLIFFLFLLFFEFILVVVDPMFSDYTGGAPLYVLGLNVIIALFFTPIHKITETKLKNKLLNK